METIRVITIFVSITGILGGVIPECPSLPALANGAICYSTKIGSIATFTCDDGYDLIGNESSTCLESLDWSNDSPVCQAIDCVTLTDPLNGIVEVTGITYGEIATFTCNTGYFIVGALQLTCTETGMWNAQEPTCRKADCGRPDRISNGQVIGQPDTTYLSVANYECDVGYNLFGQSSLKCMANGMWNGTAPQCKIKNCGIPLTPDNGDADYSNGTTYKAVTVFSCNEGYKLVGSSNAVCKEDGQWSFDVPSCEIYDCELASSPENGTVSHDNGTTYGSVAFYSCNTGHELVGSSTVECEADGQWSSGAPSCIIQDCGTPLCPENGNMSTNSGTTFGATASYSCNAGYEMVGSSTVVCEADGKWSSDAPTCKTPDCGEPTPIPHGKVSISTGPTQNLIATYECEGYYLINGTNVLVCQDGEWSGTLPTCSASIDMYGPYPIGQPR